MQLLKPAKGAAVRYAVHGTVRESCWAQKGSGLQLYMEKEAADADFSGIEIDKKKYHLDIYVEDEVVHMMVVDDAAASSSARAAASTAGAAAVRASVSAPSISQGQGGALPRGAASFSDCGGGSGALDVLVAVAGAGQCLVLLRTSLCCWAASVPWIERPLQCVLLTAADGGAEMTARMQGAHPALLCLQPTTRPPCQQPSQHGASRAPQAGPPSPPTQCWTAAAPR